MSWYVKTESKESKHHIASIIFHGPMSIFAARVFQLGVEYVDDPTISSVIVDGLDIPAHSNIRAIHGGSRLKTRLDGVKERGKK